MDKDQELAVKQILAKHLDAACQEITEKSVTHDIWWPEGFAARLAEQTTQTLALIAESNKMATDETK